MLQVDNLSNIEFESDVFPLLGQPVLIDGLASETARGYNGQTGVVTAYNHVKSRYCVTMNQSGKAVSLRLCNLTVVALPTDVDPDRAAALKSDGNKHIQQNEYQAAIHCYTQALVAAGAPAAGGSGADGDEADSGEGAVEGAVDPLWVVLLSNRAQAELGAGSVAALLRAKSDAESALKLDPAHLKTQHRLALVRQLRRCSVFRVFLNGHQPSRARATCSIYVLALALALALVR